MKSTNTEATGEVQEMVKNVNSDNYKWVQTSHSETDIAMNEKHCDCHRKNKSQVDVTAQKDNMQSEVIKWLKQAYGSEATAKFWDDKILRLAQKISKPEGEKIIRAKIEKYFKRVKSPSSECDPESRRFREQLPDHIIRKLKKINVKTEKRKYRSPVRILRIEIPTKDDTDDKQTFKTIIKDCLKDITNKENNVAGRSIIQKDVLDSIVEQLEPYVLNREYFNENLKTKLQHVIRNTLSEIPIEFSEIDRVSLDDLATSIINQLELIHEQHFDNKLCNTMYKAKQNNKEFSTFVTHQVANILEKLHISISSRRLALLEEELMEILRNFCYNSDNIMIKEDIYILLHNLVGISSYQARYFMNKIIRNFVDFQNRVKSFNQRNYELKQELYSVSPECFNLVSEDIKIMNPLNNNVCDQTDRDRKLIVKQIMEWLTDISLHTSLHQTIDLNESNITDLADDIIDLFKYFKQNSDRNNTEKSELQYLKYHIFKWSNKIPEKIRNAVIEYAPDLMKRVNNLKILNMIPIKPNTQKSFCDKDIQHLNLNVKQKRYLLKVITDWINEFLDPLDSKHKDDLAMILIYNIEKNINNCENVGNLIDEEINVWFENDLKSKLRGKIKENLEDRVKRVIYQNSYQDINFKIENIFMKQLEDIIDECLDKYFSEMNENMVDFKKRYELIHKLAMSFLNTITKYRGLSENHTQEKFEEIALQWLPDFYQHIKGNKTKIKGFIIELVNKVQKYKLDTHVFINREQSCHKSGELKTLPEYKNARVNNDATIVTALLTKSFNFLMPDTNLEFQNNTDILVPRKNFENHPQKIINTRKSKSLNEISIKKIKNVVNWQQEKLDNNVSPSKTVTVYGVTTPNNTNKRFNNNLNANLKLYYEKVVKQIENWLSEIQIPQTNEKGLRDIVINDLAGDIVDRLKYLELNPSSRNNDEDELEHLRYQIFKWVNKLVGEEQQETLDRASELMNRIRSIPSPLLTNYNVNKSDVKEIQAPTQTPKDRKQSVDKMRNIAINQEERIKETKGMTPSKKISTSTQFGLPERSIDPNKSNTLLDELKHVPEGMTLSEIYEYFDKVFKEKINELPLDNSTTEQEIKANFMKQKICDGIWTAYFVIKENPAIANDYPLVDLLMESKIDGFLDCLPMTAEMQRVSHKIKCELVDTVLLMLKYIHNIDDVKLKRETLVQRLGRIRAMNDYDIKSSLQQQKFIAEIANSYIILSKYKSEDPMKAKIYRQRLMNAANEYIEFLKEGNKSYFTLFDQTKLYNLVFNTLKSVPIPHDDVMKDEIDEILLSEEIEEWIKAVPIQTYDDEVTHRVVVRKIQQLAKKLHAIDKRNDLLDDESIDMEFKQEVSRFLFCDIPLVDQFDLNKNFMIEELTNRLRNKRKKNLLEYESFQKDKPLSSTLANINPAEMLVPLAGDKQALDEPQINQNIIYELNRQSNQRLETRTIPSIGVTNSSQMNTDKATRDKRSSDSACCKGKGILGTSQIAGPSHKFAANEIVANNEQLIPHLIAEAKPVQEYISNSSKLRIMEHPSVSRKNVSNGLAVNVACEVSVPSNRMVPTTQHLDFNALNGQQINHSSNVASHSPTNQRVSSGFVATPSGATRSTARAATTAEPDPGSQEGNDEVEDEQENEIKYTCHCKENGWKSRRRHYGMGPYPRPRFYPMPFPWRYYY